MKMDDFAPDGSLPLDDDGLDVRAEHRRERI